MLRSRFWLENQDFGASVGAICIIFRDLSVPTVGRRWPWPCRSHACYGAPRHTLGGMLPSTVACYGALGIVLPGIVMMTGKGFLP